MLDHHNNDGDDGDDGDGGDDGEDGDENDGDLHCTRIIHQDIGRMLQGPACLVLAFCGYHLLAWKYDTRLSSM